MRHYRRSLTFRLLVTAGLWLAIALTVSGFVLAAAFRDYVVNDFDVRLSNVIDHMVGATELDDGVLRFSRPIADQRFSEPYSGYYWQVSAEDEPNFRSRSLWDEALEPNWDTPAFTGRVYETPGPEEQMLRVMVRDVVLPDSQTVFRYMAAGDTQRIRADIESFDRLIIRSLGILGFGLILAVLAQIWIGLRPLKAVRTGLARIRSGKAQRLEGSFPQELLPLVEEMNALIAHNERVVERARTHVGNLAHALKTPLSVLANEARAEDTPLAETAQTQSRIMQQHIDHHLKRARASGSGVIGSATRLDKVIDDIVRAMKKVYKDRQIQFTLDMEPELLFRGERQDLLEMIGNLLDNACKWTNSVIRIRAQMASGTSRPMLRLTIEDDGPGVSDAEFDAVFERGGRLDEAVPGSGLGLAIVRDIAELCGGSVKLERSELGGVKATLSLPAAAG